MMQIHSYLNFNGNCADAFRFYERTLGGKILMLQTHGDSPMKDQVPPGWRDRVLHVHMEVDGQSIMGSDAPPEHYATPQGIYVSLTFDTPAQAERVFNAFADGGK